MFFIYILYPIIIKIPILSGVGHYLNPINFRAPLIFAQRRCAKIKGARNRPIFAHSAARKLKGARISENRQNHFLAISKPLIASRGGHFLS